MEQQIIRQQVIEKQIIKQQIVEQCVPKQQVVGQPVPDQQEDRDFRAITSIDLSVREIQNKPVYHFLYASQLYGTLFAVYGHFKTGKISSTAVSLEAIEFFLVNYKGILNMGFMAPARYNNRMIDIHVGGMQSLKKTTLHFDTPIVQEKGRRKIIKMNRILHPLSNGGPTDTGSLINSNIFDDEFHYRDGVYSEERPLRGGMLGYDDNTSAHRPAPVNDNELASPRCHESYINIIFDDRP